MKYKFHEQAPEYNSEHDSRVWPEDCYSNTWKVYKKEITWIARHLNKNIKSFKVDDMTFGDPVVFYEGKYLGYLMDDFYIALSEDDWGAWWGFDN